MFMLPAHFEILIVSIRLTETAKGRLEERLQEVQHLSYLHWSLCSRYACLMPRAAWSTRTEQANCTTKRFVWEVRWDR